MCWNDMDCVICLDSMFRRKIWINTWLVFPVYITCPVFVLFQILAKRDFMSVKRVVQNMMKKCLLMKKSKQKERFLFVIGSGLHELTALYEWLTVGSVPPTGTNNTNTSTKMVVKSDLKIKILFVSLFWFAAAAATWQI